MSSALIVTRVEIDELLRLLPSDEAHRTLSFIDALKVFDRAKDKARCAAEIAARLEPLGYKGLSLKSLYRKLADFRERGVWACVDERVARRVTAQGLAANAALVEEWQRRVLDNRRKVQPAWNRLIDDLRRGALIPGVGTWRDLYAATHGYRPAADEPCPWTVLNPPPGWSVRNLKRLAPDRFALAAARIGMGKAKMDFLPTVRLTRVGLKPCQVIEVDDMWYEHKVVFGGNMKPQRVIELAAQDRLTNHVICHLAKPVTEGEDGARKTFRPVWIRYIYHYLLCVAGVPAEGCLIKGEHGTAREDAQIAAALAAINTAREEMGFKPVVFRAGSIVTQPLAKWMPGVQHHGNPRHKGMIEQMHATLKNLVDASVFGNVGGGRGLQPEETAGMESEDAALAKVALALPAEAAGSLRYNFPTWRAFAEIAEDAHRAMDERQDHTLEGWEECGFMVGEVRYAGVNHWSSVRAMRHQEPEKAAILRRLVEAGAAEYRERRMSPAEAWAFSLDREAVEPVAPGFAPMILGKELAHTATVGDKLTMTVRDHETGERYTVAALIDGRPLPRGMKALVWVNPMDCGKAYVSDLQGYFLGVAKCLPTARADADADIPELQEQLGLRQKALADEQKRLAPHIRARLDERNRAAAANLAALGAVDPAAELAEREEAQRIADAAAAALAAKGGARVEMADLTPEAAGTPDAGGVDISELY